MPRAVNDYDAGRLQGRNVGTANALSIVSPGLITDGLVLHLDAGNYASYPASGTAMFDMSGFGNNATLTNGPTYSRDNGGAIVLDGVDDVISVTENFGMTPPNLTFEIAFKINSTTNSAYGGASTADQFIVFRQNTRISYYDAYMLSYSETNSSLTLSQTTAAGTPYLITSASNALLVGNNVIVSGVYKDSTMELYINGALSVSGSKGTLDYGTNHTLKIGRANATGSSWDSVTNGNIYSFKFYNRALGPEEVRQNFNATRARFGL